jgi:hypothetical protein
LTRNWTRLLEVAELYACGAHRGSKEVRRTGRAGRCRCWR